MVHLQFLLTLFSSAFFAILFLQSGIDKVVDWKGNYAYHSKQFASSPVKKITLPMLVIITVMELSCGLLSLAGMIACILNHNLLISFYAFCVASVNFLFLFFGLRISKDYPGAAGLVPYFIVSLLAIYFTA